MTLHAKKLSCIRQHQVVFTDISFQLTSGEVLLVQGKNGCGKSSLLRLLTGLSTPTSGDISWHDKNIQDPHADYCEHIHYIGHTNGIKLGLTVMENLQLTSQLAEKKLFKIEKTLLLLQLNHYQHTQARYLSAGQKRRLALAKLFLIPKKIWLLDEPLTALDAHTQEIFISTLESHLEQGGISVISTHQPIIFKNTTAQIMRLDAS